MGKYNNREIVWDIGNNTSDYVLMSSTSIISGGVAIYDSRYPVTTTPQTGANAEKYCLKASPTIYYCPPKYLRDEMSNITLNLLESTVIKKQPFLPTITEVKTGGTLGLTLDGRAYKTGLGYWLDGRIQTWGSTSSSYFVVSQENVATALGSDLKDLSNNAFLPKSERFGWLDAVTKKGSIVKRALRPFTLADKNKINFAANTSYTDGAWHDYQIDTANFNANNESNPNKLRIESTLTAFLQDVKYKNIATQKVLENSVVKLSVSST